MMLSLKQTESWLQDDSTELLTLLANEAERVTRQRFGHTMQLFAPLYISNECVDTCTYCAFSRPNEIVRKTLTPEQVEAEARYLIGQGLQHLLLVAGEHPKAVSPDYLQDIAQRLRPHLASLSIEVAPFDAATYRQLTGAGIDGITIYQETYNRRRYAEVHQGGPKQDYEARLAAPERAAQGGARRIGMGILLGLADWREDALSLVEHVRSMQRRYWQADFQVSLPRLKPCFGGLSDPVAVSNRDFVKLICIMRLALPEVGLVLSTRETPELRDQLLPFGITQLSAGSRTQPGGYLEPAAAEEQFATEDHRSPADVARVVTRHRLEPVWKDWEPSLYGVSRAGEGSL